MNCGLRTLRSPARAGRTSLYISALAVAAAATACDKEPTKLEKMAASANAPPASEAPPPPPPPPSAPPISVDDGSAMIGGERVELQGPDPKGRIAAILTGKPKVSGESLVVVAQRTAKMPRVAVVIDALRAAKAKGAIVKSQARDKSTVDLEIPFDASVKDCSAVGFIAKDSAISAWNVGGGTATRFARGMAGPDITLGSAGVRKVASACDAKAWVVSADESVTWGLVVDLVVAVRAGGDGGAMRATELVIPAEAPVPGRKVKLDAP